MTFTAELIYPLSPEARRGYDRREAASYVGVSPTHFDKLVRIGKMPGPVQLLGRKVWDRRALDHALDAHSNLQVGGEAGSMDELDRELAASEAKHGHN